MRVKVDLDLCLVIISRRCDVDGKEKVGGVKRRGTWMDEGRRERDWDTPVLYSFLFLFGSVGVGGSTKVDRWELGGVYGLEGMDRMVGYLAFAVYTNFTNKLSEASPDCCETEY